MTTTTVHCDRCGAEATYDPGRAVLTDFAGAPVAPPGLARLDLCGPCRAALLAWLGSRGRDAPEGCEDGKGEMNFPPRARGRRI